MVRTGDGLQDSHVPPADRYHEESSEMTESHSSSPYEQEETNNEPMGEEDDGPVMEEVGEGSEDSDSSDGRGSHSDGKRPHHTFMNLIAMAIMSSPKKMMVLPEIYDYIQKNFPFYGQVNKRAWQNAVRHNLSLHDCFVKVPRYKVEAPTTSCYWRLSDDARELYERGESLKRKGAYRRKGGPRGVCFRGMPHGAQSGTNSDPYAKQQLYSSSWRIRQPPNGAYPLRLDGPQAGGSPGKASAALDWSQTCAPYGFAQSRQRQPYALAPTSSRYGELMSTNHRQEPQRDTADSIQPGYGHSEVYRTSNYGAMDHRRVSLGAEALRDQPLATTRHQSAEAFAMDDLSKRTSSTGKLTFDTRLGLRRFAQDVQGRIYQVETFRSDRWRCSRRALELRLSQRQHSEMIRELRHEVEEAYEAVAETMRVLAKTTSAATAEAAHLHVQQQHVPSTRHVSSHHVTAWDGKRQYRYDAISRRYRSDKLAVGHRNHFVPPVGGY